LAHALHTLRADGAQEVRLDVASDNPRALALYRGAGMTERHEVQVFEKPVR
jgi:ribosomal protein S18 acetylase RimI-like enzyme